MKTTAAAFAAFAAAFLPLATPAPAAAVEFRHPLDDKPLDVPLPLDEARTEAVETFHKTGENPYIGNAQATEEGATLYDENCAACHMPEGSGGMGPSFLDEQWNYPRNKTAVGQFEVLWAGATGAMQSFKDRLTQDDMLKVIAHIADLRRQAGVGEEMAKQPEWE
ncbi:MAG: c-type cytochrome [Alphaproteobacteria bacterium]|nr:c-type cytochrome [Alphaproteobacteria bacterium]